MNQDLMRRIDFWIGVPLCFLFSGLEKFISLFQSENSNKKPKKILLVLMAEMGAIVLASPALKKLRDNNPDADLYFVTFTPGIEALKLIGFPEENIIPIRNKGLVTFALDLLKAFLQMWRLKIDTSICLDVFSRVGSIICYLSGARNRIGFYRFKEEGRYIGTHWTHRLIYNPHQHIKYSYLSLMSAANEQPSGQPLQKENLDSQGLEITKTPEIEADHHKVRAIIERELGEGLSAKPSLVILNANGSDLVTLRRWPDAYYQQLAHKLLEKNKNTYIVLTGSPSEREHAAKLAQAIGHPRVINLAGRTTLAQLIPLFQMTDLMITNDSGPAHFAALTNMKTIVLFGPETPKLFGPVGENQKALTLKLACSPCVSVYNQKWSICTNNLCMQNLTVETVYAEAINSLKGGHYQCSSVKSPK